MKILITGSRGYIGKNLIDFLSEKNFNIYKLIREKKQSTNNLFWDPVNNIFDHKIIDGYDVIINLNGQRIIKPIIPEKKTEIRDSRINPTKLLVDAINKASKPPKLLISASASGFYGNRNNEILDENSPKGRGFLSNLVEEWESIQETKKTRVIHLRLGTVIGKNSPMINMMKKYNSIVGVSSLGNGRNYFPWVGLDDVLGSIEHIIKNENIHGPVNITSYKQYILKDVLEDINLRLKPIIKLRIPKKIIKYALGELGVEVILNNQNIKPKVLLESNYKWINSTPFSSIS